MLSNESRRNRQHHYFQYLNSPIVSPLCADNEFHHDMYNRGAKDGFLITYADQPQQTFRSVDMSEMVTECGKLIDGLALYSAEELRQSGLPLPKGVEHQFKGSLINSYILNSSLAYIETIGKNGKSSFYATKHLGVVQALSNDLAETEKRKKMDSFYEQFTTTFTQLSSNIFEVIKLENDRGGLKLSKHRVNFNAKGTVIMPLYSIGNYIDKLIALIGNHRVMITYLKDNTEYKLVTSLRSDAIAKWLKTNSPNAIHKVQGSWQNPFAFGEVILPNLMVSDQYVTIQVLDITSIQKLD